MINIDLSTPALLFPAVSLLMLAYTNRFLALANLIRTLHTQYRQNHDPVIEAQIQNLRERLSLVRITQTCGLFSLLLCVVAMLCILEDQAFAGTFLFALSLVLLGTSLVVTLIEVQKQNVALNLALGNIEEMSQKRAQ
jgi:hypothetical protein